MSPAAESVLERLDGARQKWWLFTLLTTAVLAVCVSLGMLLLFMLGDALIKFSQTGLAVLFIVWLSVTAALLALVGRRLLRSQRSLEATARRVEVEFPELGSDLINVVQLSDDTRNVDRSFVEAAVNHSALRLGNVRFEEAARKESRWRRFLWCMQTPRDFGESFLALGLLLAIAVVCHLLIPNWGSAASRLMRPWQYVPSVGSVKILKVTPGNADVLLGSSLEIVAEIDNPKKKAYRAMVFVTPEGEAESRLPMTLADRPEGASPDTTERYKVMIPSVLQGFSYRLEIGDSQTDIFRVTVHEKPMVAEVEVTMRYPAYLAKASDTFVQKHADLEAPQYSEAVLRVHPSAAIARGYVRIEGETYVGRVEPDGMLALTLPLLKNTTFTIHLVSEAGHEDPNPRVNRIHVLPDAAPTVELLKPGRQETLAPGIAVPVKIRAGDDHGVGRVRLEMKVKADGAGEEGQATEVEILPVTTVEEWSGLGGKTTVNLDYSMQLPADKIQPGHTVMVRATAWDLRSIENWGLTLKPQETAGGWHAIRIIAEEKHNEAVLEQLDSLRGAIFKILERQMRARVKTAQILQQELEAEAAALAADARTDQIEIQKMAIALVKSIGDSKEEERQTVKRIMNQLAFGDMLAAVGQCDALVKVQALSGYEAPAAELGATQERITDVLRKLLDVARHAQVEELAEMKKRPGDDLPPDVKDKLDEARNKLEEFLKQQKKVIEATENLAKTPVEDFSEEEEQLIKRLAAIEDELSKFMKELNTDLSKLPEQDFSNPSLLKELNEIQTELKMAEDALLKKTVDIAVPLEQLGYEMAEEIKSNIEKWLPDTPDRERWSQEESLTDADKEAPMAELPGELEDLIGDLMEEEEDLFDEMEDVSSSAADSLDKGAGWDVMDGPISNMSAKGATGNRLPNTSEIGGRAGEGRQGKSSGEFVGDEAVGKGGRKTPSRLTPDPFMKGQIKDHSKDPQGGATGGGKESGEGGEGLEGPQSGPRGQRELNRLAGKQAALRNKAEGVELQHFQVSGYHRTDLREMIDLMAQIERDLKAGRYQNALRQRKVLAEGLGNVKEYLAGEFEVKQDATVNLPGDIQKEILGSMQDDSPTGWEELNRQYFERLSAGGTSD